ncbi:DUF6445 family protein [Gilvimarinus sp. SDUM040013]|uniref:DUF6445 family protein n=1 Tax=Gilvimarinus gilvus TaxID=3058038 RepID=A0ABU4S1I1_9GAMM|nr:DUF6445 family protein [Gilvimarinus sp. SDUM040013]MDO3387137.1 DUF6445 family protein [Gilvimarinus sp. SDUM040013]MDX6850880.1 DUF6445 family protein [Gilvimarinus sp. SDUM040013]
MQLSLNPNMATSVYELGEERSPLLVVDDFLQNPDLMVEHAAQQKFAKYSEFFPGIRAPVPVEFQSLLLRTLGRQLKQVFDLQGSKLALSLCQYSIVTVPSDKLKLLQRIPHFDSPKQDELAAVFYLFKGDLGGTSFYRHNKTGFEYIDEERQVAYYKSLESENDTDNIPQQGYINGDTALFTRIGEQKGIFNRLIIYRRRNLHSGSIPSSFIPDSSPRTGRLTISTFIDCI